MNRLSRIASCAAAACCLGNGIATAQTALADMQTIAAAMETNALYTTYYVVPEALDDGSNSLADPPRQFINDQGGSFVIRTWEGRFRPTRFFFSYGGLNGWQGPYTTYQPSRIQTGPTPYDVGTPIDQWGGPYWFYSPLGLLRGDTGSVTLEGYGDFFDRYTLVSAGPDGILRNNDDLWYQFGATVTGFAISSIRTATGAPQTTATASPGSTIIIRGINLGPDATGGDVRLDGASFGSITAWNSREVTVALPPSVETSGSLTVHRGASNSNALHLTITTPPATATDWQIFQ